MDKKGVGPENSKEDSIKCKKRIPVPLFIYVPAIGVSFHKITIPSKRNDAGIERKHRLALDKNAL
ncbi:hypothetical protein [Christensenella tenuis]|jgi:hypothetical protein|uniref:Uncharacterized protein n=1 Tax=Christensenella tenuis TaxID=2763033 RepID=A0ABR7EFI5_9FIRM|nr:hypothetical protein [Christensenella tenuis]MBC5648528.1 hypothetical protein [Christensenella tenuis]